MKLTRKQLILIIESLINEKYMSRKEREDAAIAGVTGSKRKARLAYRDKQEKDFDNLSQNILDEELGKHGLKDYKIKNIEESLSLTGGEVNKIKITYENGYVSEFTGETNDDLKNNILDMVSSRDNKDMNIFLTVQKSYARALKKFFNLEIREQYEDAGYKLFHAINAYDRGKSKEDLAKFKEVGIADNNLSGYTLAFESILNKSGMELSTVLLPEEILSVYGGDAVSQSKAMLGSIFPQFGILVDGHLTSALHGDTMTTTVKDAIGTMHSSGKTMSLGGYRHEGEGFNEFVKYLNDIRISAHELKASTLHGPWKRWLTTITGTEGTALETYLDKRYKFGGGIQTNYDSIFTGVRDYNEYMEATVDNWNTVGIYYKAGIDFLAKDISETLRLASQTGNKEYIELYNRVANSNKTDAVSIYTAENLYDAVGTLSDVLSKVEIPVVSDTTPGQSLQEGLSRGSLYRKRYWGRY